jgi:UDP-GlcNAc:undecaprenyl-phosphate GlcNAc-1-phosphate transferase
MVIYLVLFGVALGGSLVLMPMLARLGERARLMDEPGARKLHSRAIPRIGGVGVALSLVVTLGVALVLDAHPLITPRPSPQGLLPVLVGAMLVFAVGLWDDVSPVPAVRKLGVQLVAAGIVAGSDLLITRVTMFGDTFTLGVLAIPLTVLWIVAITNAFNLMDGLDGLAGGLVVIAASTCALVLVTRGEHPAAMLLVSLTGATTGFLIYNFHPARIFLGDSGSLLAGFLLAVTAIIGRQKGATTLATAVPLLIFALPLLDTGVSVVRRLSRRGSIPAWHSPPQVFARVFAADREHIHHRLIALGLSHRAAVLLLYALAVACSVLALLLIERPR